MTKEKTKYDQKEYNRIFMAGVRCERRRLKLVLIKLSKRLSED